MTRLPPDPRFDALPDQRPGLFARVIDAVWFACAMIGAATVMLFLAAPFIL